jgi:polysaccharide export outer membrane protein
MQRRSHEHSSLLSSFRFYFFALSLLLCFTSSGRAQEIQTSSGKLTAQAPSPFLSDAAVRMAANNSGGGEDDNYRIGAGDMLDVRVFQQPDLSSAARVSSQGTIRLPFVGDVQAACLTEGELAKVIAEKYRKYINNPQVDVFIKEYQSQPVAVIGAVDKPARFQLQRRVKLLELLTFAGGPTKDAGYAVHVIHGGNRNLCAMDQNGGVAAAESAVEGISFSSYKLSELLSGGAAANVYVSPGDVVSVPEADQIFVTGMVIKPGSVRMVAGTTLTQAIAMAGGLMPEAGKKVRLLRKKPGSTVVEEKVYNIDDIQKKKTEDVTLEASDVVDVSNSTGKSVAQSLLRQIAPTLGLVPYIIGTRR